MLAFLRLSTGPLLRHILSYGLTLPAQGGGKERNHNIPPAAIAYGNATTRNYVLIQFNRQPLRLGLNVVSHG